MGRMRSLLKCAVIAETNMENRPQTQNRWGGWVEAIREPYYRLFRKECFCGDKYWTMSGYRGHYAVFHILGLED